MATSRAEPPRTRKPSWLKVRMPGSPRYHKLKERARSLSLATVCEEARCPNIGECWAEGTATFMVMGDTCTRGCRFCAVNTLKIPQPLDADEPNNVARAIAELELNYVVLTSVDRDDVPDGGAAHFAACITAIREQSPDTMVEVLIPDFAGIEGDLWKVVDTEATVIAHNIETVPRLQNTVRDRKANYTQSLKVLSDIKALDPTKFTKSSIMVGLGESADEVIASMQDLRDVGCNFLTIGQYLQPTTKHLEVVEFIHPDQFAEYERIGLEMGFGYVASGPLVRSSYKAGEFFIRKFVAANTANEVAQ